jgi:hypothetical protein
MGIQCTYSTAGGSRPKGMVNYFSLLKLSGVFLRSLTATNASRNNETFCTAAEDSECRGALSICFGQLHGNTTQPHRSIPLYPLHLERLCKNCLPMRLRTPKTSGPKLTRFALDAVRFMSLEIITVRRITIQIVPAMNMSPAKSWTSMQGIAIVEALMLGAQQLRSRSVLVELRAEGCGNVHVVGNTIKAHTMDRVAGRRMSLPRSICRGRIWHIIMLLHRSCLYARSGP